MPDSRVAAVKSLAVRRVQVLHQAGERLLPRPQQQVRVIPHQTIPDALHIKALQQAGEQFEKVCEVDVVDEDVLLVVAT
jgi:hypothetical protein